MGARRGDQTEKLTNLAHLRVEKHLSQQEVSEMTGIPLSTYRRLERGLMPNPPIRYLVNIILAFGLDAADLPMICEEEWLEWTWFAGKGHEYKEPPALSRFAKPWRLAPKPDPSITNW